MHKTIGLASGVGRAACFLIPPPHNIPPLAHSQPLQVLVLQAYDEAAQTTAWQLADVRANAPAKGRKMSKRQLAMRLELAVSQLRRVRVHVDF